MRAVMHAASGSVQPVPLRLHPAPPRAPRDGSLAPQAAADIAKDSFFTEKIYWVRGGMEGRKGWKVSRSSPWGGSSSAPGSSSSSSPSSPFHCRLNVLAAYPHPYHSPLSCTRGDLALLLGALGRRTHAPAFATVRRWVRSGLGRVAWKCVQATIA